MFAVVNFHFTDKCNYKCKYCFAPISEQNELSLKECYSIIDNIHHYFTANNLHGRINFVGGEPLIDVNKLNKLIVYTYNKKIESSIVTNGYYLSDDLIKENSNKLTMIGISVDSINNATNLLIGRVCNKKTLDLSQLISICDKIKRHGIKLKINHVVSTYNLNENIFDLLDNINFDRLKIMQMTIVNNVNKAQNGCAITKDEFLDYAKQYQKYNPIIETDNDVASSYLFINSSGYLMKNENNEQVVVANLLTDKLIDQVTKVNLNEKVYQKRY